MAQQPKLFNDRVGQVMRDTLADVQQLDPKTNTWTQSIPLPFYTTKGLPFWKRFNEKNWRPQCTYCKTVPIFETSHAFAKHYSDVHLITKTTTSSE